MCSQSNNLWLRSQIEKHLNILIVTFDAYCQLFSRLICDEKFENFNEKYDSTVYAMCMTTAQRKDYYFISYIILYPFRP